MIAGGSRKRQMCRFPDILRRRERRPVLTRQNIGGRDAILVVVFKILRHDLALHVHDVDSRIRDSVSERARVGGLIQNVEGVNDFRIGVGKKRIGDMPAIGEALEHTNRVITDCSNLFPDRRQILLQLHELDFTEGSPIRGTEKDQHGALRTHD